MTMLTTALSEVERQGEEHAFEYLFPFPLADLYRRYRTARTPSDGLGYLLAGAEASLKIVTAASVATISPNTLGNYSDI